MKTLLTALLAALLSAPLGALPAAAAVIDIPFAEAAFLSSGGAGDLLFEAEAVLDGVPAQDDVVALFALAFDLADPYGTATASLDLTDIDGLVLGGLLSAISFEEDLLRLTFSGLDGAAAALFGPQLSFELFFVDAVGPDPLAGLEDGTTYDVAGVGVLAPIPLPASGLLLLTVLGGAAALGRRGRTSPST